MRVDLLIEARAHSREPWIAIAKSLLQRAPENPPFSLAMGSDLRSDGAPGRLIQLSLCTMASDIVEVMGNVFEAVGLAQLSSGAPITVHIDGGSVLNEGRWLADFHQHAVSDIANALEQEVCLDSIRTPDDVLRLFRRVTGVTHSGTVRREEKGGQTGYSLGLADGGRLFATRSPIGRGWMIFDSRSAGKTPCRSWITAPQYQHFSQCLMLEYCFPDIGMPLLLTFSHAAMHEIDAGINRNYFTSSLGPLAVHTRELASNRCLLQLVVEIPEHGEIRSFVIPRGATPGEYGLIASLPF